MKNKSFLLRMSEDDLQKVAALALRLRCNRSAAMRLAVAAVLEVVSGQDEPTALTAG